MQKTGNSSTERCVNNLCSLTQGEVPLDQLRGIRADVIDMPITRAVPFLQASVFSTIESYEPRMDFGKLDVTVTSAQDGAFRFTITN